MTIFSIPDKTFRKAVAASKSMQDVFYYLEIRGGGKSYTSVRKKIKELNLDTSHWEESKSGRKSRTIPLEEVLVKDSDYHHTSALKKRLVRAGILEYHCHICGIREWQNKPISLHLDHISGDVRDNRVENLRLLCPNCHSQTPTFGNKGKKKRSIVAIEKAIKQGRKKIKHKSKFCQTCGKGVTREAQQCKSCYGKQREKTKIKWPEINELVQMVKNHGYVAVGKKLGVSDNAVRKHIKNHS